MFQKIEDIRKDKIDVIVGDVISVRIAEKYGLDYHLIESSEESVKTAIEKALSIMTNVQREMEELGKTRAIFDSVNDGIISLDKTLKIDQFNSQAREYLMGYSRKGTLKGRSIMDFVKDSNIPEVLKNQEKSEGRLFSYWGIIPLYSTPPPLLWTERPRRWLPSSSRFPNFRR